MRKPNGYWNDKSNVAKEALKYTTRKDFHKGSSGCYTIAARKGWLDDVCGHMDVIGHRYQRFVYEIADHFRKVVYVGLTFHPKRRLEAHRSTSKHVTDRFGTDEFLKMKLLTDLLPIAEAVKIESDYVQKYESAGYEVLNRTKTGGLGANHKMWTPETTAKEALKYTNRTDFAKGSSGAYTIACREGWIDDICKHTVLKKAPAGSWSKKEDALEEAKKYATQGEFREKANGCFTICHKKGWLNEACAHMNVRPKLPNGHWHEKDNCRKEASKYNGRGDFAKGSVGAYKSSRKNKWLDEFFPK